MMEIDEYFDKFGEIGRYNLVLLPLVLIFGGVLPSWSILASVFVFYEPDHYCKTDGEPNTTIHLTDDGEFEECTMYQQENNDSIIPCQNGWTYSGKAITAVTEFDLVCDKSILAVNAVSVYFVGILVSAFIGGHLTDMFGRKTMAFVGMIGGMIVGVGITFTQSYIAFLVMWFLSALFIGRVWSSFFPLTMEIFQTKFRASATCLQSIAWSTGLCFLSLIAYIFQNWRHFLLVISLPFLLAIPSWWFIVESPRWLMSKYRWNDAKAAFCKIAKFNGMQESELRWIETLEEDVGCMNKKEEKFHTFIDTVRTPRLRRTTLLLFVIWFVNSMVYYGLALSSSKIAGDRFINFLLLSLAEIPAGFIALYALTRFGRRHLLFVFHTVAAIACISVAFIPQETESGVNLTLLITTLSFIGKLCISMTFTIIWVFSTELYPTIIRTTGVSTCSMFSRFGGITAPYIMHLGDVLNWLPMSVFGVVSLAAGFSALPIPETINRPLPQTINDVEWPKYKPGSEEIHDIL